MARAKRTQRAEARRRNRAAAPDAATDLERRRRPATDEPLDPSAAARRRRRRRADGVRGRVQGGVPPAERASRPRRAAVDRDAHPALWVPLAITLASTIAIIATKGGDISLFMFAVLHPDAGHRRRLHRRLPRPAGELAARRRSSACSRPTCYSVLVLGFPTTIYAALLRRPRSQAQEVALSAFILSPIIGAFFAAGAAWYRRFLRLSSPNRGRARSQKSNAKKTGRRPNARRHDGQGERQALIASSATGRQAPGADPGPSIGLRRAGAGQHSHPTNADGPGCVL